MAVAGLSLDLLVSSEASFLALKLPFEDWAFEGAFLAGMVIGTVGSGRGVGTNGGTDWGLRGSENNRPEPLRPAGWKGLGRRTYSVLHYTKSVHRKSQCPLVSCDRFGVSDDGIMPLSGNRYHSWDSNHAMTS